MVSSSASLLVDGGLAAQTCSTHSSGAGGAGLIQLEDGDGIVNTSFVGATSGANNVIVLQSPFTGAMVSDTSTSAWFDTNALSPVFTGATENVTPGTGTVSITYQGAFSSPSNPNVPNVATVSAPVTAAALGTLSGYRFIRFSVTLAYPAPPATTAASPRPFVSDISIQYAN